MRIQLVAVTAAAFFLTCFASLAEAGVLISVNKSAQQMSVIVDGVEQYRWPVSTGRTGYGTPSGTFHPSRMEAVYNSKEFDNAPMPHAIFFTSQGHAIHGSYEVSYLGRPVSHGCVRISPQNAATLYSLVKEEGMGNTEVVISGGRPAVPQMAGARPQAPEPGYGWQGAGWQRGGAWAPPSYGRGMPPWFYNPY